MAGGHEELMQKVQELHTLMQETTDGLDHSMDKMCQAIETLARTHTAAEKRYADLEDRLYNCHDQVIGKGQIPLVSHYIILCSMVGLALLVVLYVNQQSIEATLTSVTVSHKKDSKDGK